MRAGKYSGICTRLESRARAGVGRGIAGSLGSGSLPMSTFPQSVDNDAGRVERGVRLTKGGDHAVAAAFSRAEVDEQHLILAVVNDLAELVPAANQVDRGELAFEDRVLQVIAEAAHGLVDFAEALVVADVVADEI